jgi:chemotaxis signal transduction protein
MSERLLLFTPAGPDDSDREARLTLALPAGLGREAFSPQHLLPLPGGQAGLLGLTEVRGRTVPLIDLVSLLNSSGRRVSDAPATVPALALLIEVGGETLALPVGQVLGVVVVDVLPACPALLSGPFSAGDRTVQLLNTAALIAAAEIRLALV